MQKAETKIKFEPEIPYSKTQKCTHTSTRKVSYWLDDMFVHCVNGSHGLS